MDRILKRLTITAGVVAIAALPLNAQTGDGSFGIRGSWLKPATLAEGPQTDLSFDETLAPGAELEFWFGGSNRLGLGLQGAISKWNHWDPDVEDPDFGYPVSMYHYDATLKYRLVKPRPGRTFLPFIMAGAGAITVNPDDEESLGGASEMDYPAADIRLDTETHTETAIVAGVGADVFLRRNLSVRFEAKDYWTDDSPYQRLSSGAFHEGGHNVVLSAGINLHWGGAQRQQADFVQQPPAPRPEPEPAVEPEPEPEPEPVTETVRMCVVGDDGRLSTVAATRYIESDRVVVDRNGAEVDFESAHPARAPLYVKGASWYVNDQPMTVRLDEDDLGEDLDDELDDAAEKMANGDEDADISSLKFVRFGTTASMNSGDLVYVGSVEGTPMYVARSEAAAIMPRIRSALADEDDLEVTLRSDAELAREFSEIETLYVAVEPGCVFQPVSLTTYVRATRGQ